MAASLSLNEPVRCLQQDLVALLVQAADILADDDMPAATRIHETRKRLKRARAWALILPRQLAERIDGALRDIHRALGARRDLDASQEAIARLLRESRNAPRAREALMRVRENLRDTAAATPAASSDASTVHAIRRALLALASQLGREQPGGDFGQVARRASRIARRSRRQMRRALASGEPHDFHRWRKWMKYHAFHLRYLAPLWPALLRIEADAAEQCAEWLGESQDIELVRAALASTTLEDASRHAAVLLLDREQQRLLRRATSIGLHLHALWPRAFGERLAGYWQARLQHA